MQKTSLIKVGFSGYFCGFYRIWGINIEVSSLFHRSKKIVKGCLRAVGLVPLVIQQSWRETVLRVGDGQMRLMMGGPLARRRWSWRLEQVLAVRVIATQVREDDGAPVLGEVEILAEGSPPLRLFTDHREGMLNGMVVEIERAVRGPVD